MNKQEKNIVDILTFDEIEDIVEIFINKMYRTDKTVALLTNKELVEYAMNELLKDGNIFVKRVDLELEDEDAEYMISVDDYGYMIVQPIEYYDDKYFKDIEYAFVDMDGCISQVTIDNLLCKDVPVVLFGYDDGECECSKCECACHKDEKSTTPTELHEKYTVNGKSVTKEEFDKEYEKFEQKYMDNVKDMLLRYNYFIDDMNEFRKRFFRW